MEKSAIDKITYLLNYLDSCIVYAVQEVLEDSADDPNCSAVTTANLIKCYIDVKTALGQATSFSDIDEYLQFNCFTPDEICEFEQKRSLEATYYIGKQY